MAEQYGQANRHERMVGAQELITQMGISQNRDTRKSSDIYCNKPQPFLGEPQKCEKPPL